MSKGEVMKTQIQILPILLFIGLVLILISCSEQNNTPTGPNEPPPIQWDPPPFNEDGWAVITTFPDSLVNPGGNVNLRIIEAADARVAWVSDWQTKLIFKTEDGGSTWKVLEPPVTGSLYTIESFDSLTLWIGTQQGEILNSIDGGYSWVEQHKGSFINYIEFFDRQNGIAMGDPPQGSSKIEILHTSNGGVTWTNKNSIIGYGTTHYAVNFCDQNNGWIRTRPSNEFVFHTNDGGITWDTLYPGGSQNIWTLVCVSPKIAMLSYNLTPMRTSDTGQSWQELSLSIVGYPSRYAKVKDASSWVWGEGGGGEVFGSTDSGETWKIVSTGINDAWWDINSPSKDVVWLSGRSKITYTVKADSLLSY